MDEVFYHLEEVFNLPALKIGENLLLVRVPRREVEVFTRKGWLVVYIGNLVFMFNKEQRKLIIEEEGEDGEVLKSFEFEGVRDFLVKAGESVRVYIYF